MDAESVRRNIMPHLDGLSMCSSANKSQNETIFSHITHKTTDSTVLRREASSACLPFGSLCSSSTADDVIPLTNRVVSLLGALACTVDCSADIHGSAVATKMYVYPQN
jgi:hypothetical protein